MPAAHIANAPRPPMVTATIDGPSAEPRLGDLLRFAVRVDPPQVLVAGLDDVGLLDDPVDPVDRLLRGRAIRAGRTFGSYVMVADVR